MEIKRGDRVRGEAWGQPFSGKVYATANCGIPRHKLVSIRLEKEIRTPMFTEDGDIGSGNLPVVNVIVSEETGFSPCGKDWLEPAKEESAC